MCTATRLSLHLANHVDAPLHSCILHPSSKHHHFISPTPRSPLLVMPLLVQWLVRAPSLPHRYRMRDARTASYISRLICLVRRLCNARCNAAALRVRYAKRAISWSYTLAHAKVYHSMRTTIPYISTVNFSGTRSETPSGVCTARPTPYFLKHLGAPFLYRFAKPLTCFFPEVLSPSPGWCART